MTSILASLDVVNNTAAGRFESDLGDDIAVLDYVQAGDVITFTHTGVPPAFRRQGIAARITRVVPDYVRTEKLTVVPRCWYTAAFIRRHPEYQPLVKMKE